MAAADEAAEDGAASASLQKVLARSTELKKDVTTLQTESGQSGRSQSCR